MVYREIRNMGQISLKTCEIEGLKIIEPKVFGDERGYFMDKAFQQSCAVRHPERKELLYLDIMLEIQENMV